MGARSILMTGPAILRTLKRLGHDSFLLDGSPVIYIDPWKIPPGSPAADIVLVTHEHFDHCSPADVAKVSRAGTVVIANQAAAAQLKGARVLRHGESLEVAGATVEAVPAYNVNKFRSPGQPFHPVGAEGNGYVVTIAGESLYHAGDADFIPEMAGMVVTVALLPVSGTFVMTAEEAFEAAKAIRAEVYVPMHYGDIVGSNADVEKFRALCEGAGKRVVVL
jgi:L-ascorbate metabolism protein UlaG (beta-lactamase superfamily)